MTGDRSVERSWYSPERVRAIVRNWDSWLAREENPSAARGLLLRGPTPEDPKLTKQRGHHGDPMVGVPVVADIVRAWQMLDARPVPFGEKGLPYRVVAYIMLQYSESGIAVGMRRPEGDIRAVLDEACTAMAVTLGWEPDELHPYQDEPQTIRACDQCGEPIGDLRADARFCSAACRLRAWRGGVVATATG